MHNLWGFFQKSLFTENYFLIVATNLANRGPLYTCLVVIINGILSYGAYLPLGWHLENLLCSYWLDISNWSLLRFWPPLLFQLSDYIWCHMVESYLLVRVLLTHVSVDSPTGSALASLSLSSIQRRKCFSASESGNRLICIVYIGLFEYKPSCILHIFSCLQDIFYYLGTFHQMASRQFPFKIEFLLTYLFYFYLLIA